LALATPVRESIPGTFGIPGKPDRLGAPNVGTDGKLGAENLGITGAAIVGADNILVFIVGKLGAVNVGKIGI